MRFTSCCTLVLIIITFLFNDVISVDIECEYKHDEYYSLPSTLSCIVQNDLTITAKNTKISNLNAHYYKNLIKGLSIQSKEVYFMPENFDEHFAELIAIRIKECNLQEIHQSDLKSFVLLRYLNLDSNKIEVLEDDLFKFNPLLELIWMEANRIKSIGSTTFNNLNKLKDLDLNRNICISRRSTHIYGMRDLFASIRLSCSQEVASTTTTSTTTTTEIQIATTTEASIINKATKIDIPQKSSSNSLVWIVVGVAVACVLALLGFVVIKSRMRSRNDIVRPIEPDDY